MIKFKKVIGYVLGIAVLCAAFSTVYFAEKLRILIHTAHQTIEMIISSCPIRII